MWARHLLPLGLFICVAACGAKGNLSREDGKAPPVPVGHQQPLSTTEMLKPTPQSAPERVDDPVKRSRARPEDPFDLPPGN